VYLSASGLLCAGPLLSAMALGRDRRVAYGCGALTGSFTTIALLADGIGGRWPWVVGALVCGALAVAFEERAQRRA